LERQFGSARDANHVAVALMDVVLNPMRQASPKDVSLRIFAPCNNYEDLRTLAELTSMADAYKEAESFQSIADLTAKLITFKNVLKSLLVAWKSSVKELEKAVADMKAANEQSVKDAEKAKKKSQGVGQPAAKRKKGNDAMDTCLDKGTALTVFNASVDGWQGLDGAREIFQAEEGMQMSP